MSPRLLARFPDDMRPDVLAAGARPSARTGKGFRAVRHKGFAAPPRQSPMYAHWVCWLLTSNASGASFQPWVIGAIYSLTAATCS